MDRPGILILELPEITQRMGDLLRARDETGWDTYLKALWLRALDADKITELAFEVLAVMPQDVQDWWNSVCTCGARGPHACN